MPVNKVEILGLADLRRDLRSANKTAPKALQRTNKKIADRVVDKARGRYRTRYTSRSGKGEGSIRALASATTARVAIGRPSLAYVAAQNFGSMGRYPQFMPRRSPDLFLYATIEAEMPGIRDDYLDVLMDTLREAFPGAR